MHAYLIMTHGDFDILEKTLLLLDDENNDFYIHVDKKVKNFNFDYYKGLVKYSNIYFLKKRRNIFWGSHRIIWTELDLFKEAYKNHYEYYHLLSGCDMPIKNKIEIKEFFENHQDTEFININKISDSNNNKDRINRFKYFYFLKSSRIDSYFRGLQKLFHIDRYKDKYEAAFGSEWVSLSNSGVKALIRNEKWIKKTYKYTYCCDEIYKQTIIHNENLKIYKGEVPNLRYIIWDDGISEYHPRVLRETDYEDIISSGCLFARKFSSKDDKIIIEKITNALSIKQ